MLAKLALLGVHDAAAALLTPHPFRSPSDSVRQPDRRWHFSAVERSLICTQWASDSRRVRGISRSLLEECGTVSWTVTIARTSMPPNFLTRSMPAGAISSYPVDISMTSLASACARLR